VGAGAAVGIAHPAQIGLPRLTRPRIGRAAVLLAIVGLALALRVPHLATIPPDVHGDEAAVGLDGRSIIHGGWSDLFQLGWAGVPLGVCAIGYFAGREAFPIVGLYLLYRIVRERGFLRANALGFACALVGLWVFLAPVAVTFTHTQGALSGRAESVWLFSPDNLAHERQVYGTSSTLRIVGKQT